MTDAGTEKVPRQRGADGSYAPRLSHELVVDTALALAMREGGSVLTVRNLGRELGADPAAFYRYFRNKDDLILMVADRILGEVSNSIPVGLNWQDKLVTMGLQMVTILSKYAAVGALIGSRTTRRANEIAIVEDLLETLRSTGLSDEDAALCYRTYADYVLAYAAARAQWVLLDADLRQADESAWQDVYGVLDPEEFPNIGHLGPHLAEVDDDVVLLSGLQMLVDGIALKAARTRSN